MTENEAIDWYLATVAPEPLAKAIQQQIGYLVSLELGELAEPFARCCKDKETEGAIVHLQTAVAKRFGQEIWTDTGRATLSIAHDRIELTSPHGHIVAQRVASIARQLEKANSRGEMLPVK